MIGCNAAVMGKKENANNSAKSGRDTLQATGSITSSTSNIISTMTHLQILTKMNKPLFAVCTVVNFISTQALCHPNCGSRLKSVERQTRTQLTETFTPS